jgi:hypothetical protein
MLVQQHACRSWPQVIGRRLHIFRHHPHIGIAAPREPGHQECHTTAYGRHQTCNQHQETGPVGPFLRLLLGLSVLIVLPLPGRNLGISDRWELEADLEFIALTQVLAGPGHGRTIDGWIFRKGNQLSAGNRLREVYVDRGLLDRCDVGNVTADRIPPDLLVCGFKVLVDPNTAEHVVLDHHNSRFATGPRGWLEGIVQHQLPRREGVGVGSGLVVVLRCTNEVERLRRFVRAIGDRNRKILDLTDPGRRNVGKPGGKLPSNVMT